MLAGTSMERGLRIRCRIGNADTQSAHVGNLTTFHQLKTFPDWFIEEGRTVCLRTGMSENILQRAGRRT